MTAAEKRMGESMIEKETDPMESGVGGKSQAVENLKAN